MNADAHAWFRAAADPGLAAALRRIHADVAREIASRGPACWASGRCCHFERAGHFLYVTGLEAAFTLLHTSGTASRSPGTLTLPQLVAAPGACPFLEGHLCAVHDVKPLGCRVYFCDRSAQAWQHDLSERALADLRALHDAHAIPYRYAEWRSLLRELTPHIPTP